MVNLVGVLASKSDNIGKLWHKLKVGIIPNRNEEEIALNHSKTILLRPTAEINRTQHRLLNLLARSVRAAAQSHLFFRHNNWEKKSMGLTHVYRERELTTHY